MTTGSVGRSLRSVAVVAIASTTCCDSGSTTSPKIVWRRFRCGVWPDRDEELRAVGARARIRHRQQVRLVELQFGVELVGELVARTTATGARRVAALDHEAVDDPVEDRAIVERAGGPPDAFSVEYSLVPWARPTKLATVLGAWFPNRRDLDVAAVGVERGGGGLKGAVGHGMRVCHYGGRAAPVSPRRPAKRGRAACWKPMSLCWQSVRRTERRQMRRRRIPG